MLTSCKARNNNTNSSACGSFLFKLPAAVITVFYGPHAVVVVRLGTTLSEHNLNVVTIFWPHSFPFANPYAKNMISPIKRVVGHHHRDGSKKS